MKIKVWILFILASLCILLVGCTSKINESTKESTNESKIEELKEQVKSNEKVECSLLTPAEVNKFISENSINTLSIKEANDFTIVLFKNEREYGNYVLYKGPNNEFHCDRSAIVGFAEESPVSLGGFGCLGKTSFVTIIINDEDMLKKAEAIKIIFGDETEVKERISGKGTIILHENETVEEKPISYPNLIIYGKDGMKLFEQ